ncbi:hypothetical protein WIW89_04480 [Stygiolobus sp. CP850M]|uniref:hypothetical protein n=1 Tax=Stygiolobus sp. CP850M TaxID=3133134 RepID=UPI00307ED13C
MKIVTLLPLSAKNLKEVNEAIVSSLDNNKHKYEIFSLSYQKISVVGQSSYDMIFSPELLEGEMSLLHLLSPLVIRTNSSLSFHTPRLRPPLKLELKGKSLLIGSPLVEGLISVTSHDCLLSTDEEIRAVYPLPFRDEVFDNVILSEIMDYDLVKEAYRITKRGGKGFIIVPFCVDPVNALKVLSVKFRIINAIAKNRFWIIEGIKIDSKRV